MQMPSKVELGELSVALLGLWALLEAISSLAVLIPFILADGGALYGGKLQLAPLVIWILVAGILVGFRHEIAVRLFARGSTRDDGPSSAEPQQLEELLFAAVGLWWMASAASYGLQIEVELWQDFSFR